MKVKSKGLGVRISELSRRTGVCQRLLRYYEEQGLLKPTRLGNGYRDYTEADVRAVRQIRSLLAVGIPTRIIFHFLRCVRDSDGQLVGVSCPDLIRELTEEMTRVEQTIVQLRSGHSMLAMLLAVVGGMPQEEAGECAPSWRPPVDGPSRAGCRIAPMRQPGAAGT